MLPDGITARAPNLDEAQKEGGCEYIEIECVYFHQDPLVGVSIVGAAYLESFLNELASFFISSPRQQYQKLFEQNGPLIDENLERNKDQIHVIKIMVFEIDLEDLSGPAK